MKETKYSETISEKTINKIRSLGNKLSIEEGVKFISKDLKIAPNCVELILTTLGYIYRVSDHICGTKRLFKLTKYDPDICTDKLTANGLELFYHLVFNSVCRDKSQSISHPVIFDRDVQTLALYDDKNLIQIDVALDKIYEELAIKNYCINEDTNIYHSMLENANMFKFNADGSVAKCIADIEYYTYYIYDAEDVDKFNIINDLSINSKEIYIDKETYDKLAFMIENLFIFKFKTDLYKMVNARGCKIDGDKTKEDIKMDTDISLSLFISMVIDNCENKYNESDVIKVLVDAGLIKIGNDDCIYINDSNDIATKYLYKSHSGRILVRTDNILKLFCIVASVDCNIFNSLMHNTYNDLFDDNKK